MAQGSSKGPGANPETARLIAGTVVMVTLIAGGVTLSALGRPLTELLGMVGLAVMPILVGLGFVTVKNTNGANTELLNLVKKRLDTDAEEKAHLLSQNAAQSAMLAAASPVPSLGSSPEDSPVSAG